MNKRNESGELMLEAAIYFPIVILVVALMVCVGVAKLQQCVMFFETEKIANNAAKCIVYVGYDKLAGVLDNSTVVDLSQAPGDAEVKAYYEAKKGNLYKEWAWDYSAQEKAFESLLSDMLTSFSFLNGIGSSTEVDVKGGLIPNVQVTVTYSLEFPHMFEFLVKDSDKEGMFSDVKVASYSRCVAVDPVEFVRNTDIAFDVLDFLLDKFGIDVDKFMNKLKVMKDKLLII